MIIYYKPISVMWCEAHSVMLPVLDGHMNNSPHIIQFKTSSALLWASYLIVNWKVSLPFLEYSARVRRSESWSLMFFLCLLSWSRTASLVCNTVVCDISWSLLFYHRSGMVLLVTRCGVGGEEVLVFMGETDFYVV